PKLRSLDANVTSLSAELPQSRVCKEEELLSEQQLCLQERKPSLDQEDPDPPEIKEEQEELCTSPEGEQLEPKQEAFTLTPTCEERGHGEDQLLDSCTDEAESVVQETSLEYISVESTAVVELNNDHQLLSHNPLRVRRCRLREHILQICLIYIYIYISQCICLTDKLIVNLKSPPHWGKAIFFHHLSENIHYDITFELSFNGP
uniref:Uncharacterized protein n=1 Tax=Gasterosteus aculeatus TaxID=69293 RepID=G3NL06_GASAC